MADNMKRTNNMRQAMIKKQDHTDKRTMVKGLKANYFDLMHLSIHLQCEINENRDNQRHSPQVIEAFQSILTQLTDIRLKHM